MTYEYIPVIYEWHINGIQEEHMIGMRITYELHTNNMQIT